MKEKLSRAFGSFLIVGIVAMTMSCKDGSDGLDGLTSLINVTPEAAGATCLDGGLKLETGIDRNRNGKLESEEVQQTEFVCNGTGGTTSNEIRFRVANYTGNGSSEVMFSFPELIDFDIRNYPDIDSAVFVVDGASSSLGNGIVSFQLYDATHSTYIADTKLSTDVVPGTRLYTGNILSKLPQAKVDLIMSETPGAFCLTAWLFLYDTK